MMKFFEEYLGELQPFKEYWSLMFEKKRMSVVLVGAARIEVR
jgi:hypothetical protein